MRSLIYKLNPTTKIWIMILLFLPITFSYDIVFTPLIFLLLTISVSIFANDLPISILFYKLRGMILASVFLIIFLLLSRGFNKEGIYQLGVFGFSKEDIKLAFSLGFRMITFAYITIIFISTTNAVDLILSLINQWKLPYKACYAFLAAYRFAPTFGEELNKIRIAHESRGLGTSNNPFINLIYTPRYLIPLLISAIRKGERVAIAMDARAFGYIDNRTYFKETTWEKRDTWTLIASIVLISIILYILISFNLFEFSLSINKRG